MLKNIFLSSAIVAATLSNAAMANPAPYVGGSFGITTNTSNLKGTADASGLLGGNFRGVPFNAFIGYGGCFNQNFYLAGELTGTMGTASISNNNGLKTSYGYGVSVLPGVMLSDHTIAFARVGVVRERFTNQKENQTGGQFGLGLQTTLTQNVDLRTEYDYIPYRSINGVVNNRQTASISPRSDQFMVGLVYTFD